MSEFYTAEYEETPVAIDYPTVWFDEDNEDEPARQMIQWRRDYYGSKLTIGEIIEKLLSIGYIDCSDKKEEGEYSLDMKTGQPLYPGRHEFWVGETEDFGSPFGCETNGSRVTVKIHLYYYEWDEHPDDCPWINVVEDVCGHHHATTGWEHENILLELLALNDNGW
jgi:hypothetical protein